MKYEWRKQEKSIYGGKKSPALVDVPKRNYIILGGKGNPNAKGFSEKVSALYSLAYAIKMNYKSEISNSNPDMIQDFTVYPLEGIWKGKKDIELIKEKLEYNIMICQPDFITDSMVNKAFDIIKKKKPNPLYNEIYFDTMQDGKCVEILHVGSYDEEPVSFLKMDEFIAQNGYQRKESWHREIYLNNAKRVLKTKLKTILRYTIE